MKMIVNFNKTLRRARYEQGSAPSQGVLEFPVRSCPEPTSVSDLLPILVNKNRSGLAYWRWVVTSRARTSW